MRVRGIVEAISEAVAQRLATAWAIFTDSDDGHAKLKKPDDSVVDLEAAGGGGFTQENHDAEDHTGIPGVGGGETPGAARWIGPWTYRWFDTIYVSVTADSGTFTLTVNGEETAAIAYDADLPTMVAAIVALSGVTADDVGIDDGPGNIGFALGFLDEPVTADATDLVGVGAEVLLTPADRVVALFTLAEGDVLDNLICQRVAAFDAGTPGAFVTEDPGGDTDPGPWSAPYRGGYPLAKQWALDVEEDFPTLIGTGGASSPNRSGARQVEYGSDPGETEDEWYVTLPTLAISETPIYLRVLANDWSSATQGEINIFALVATPAAP